MISFHELWSLRAGSPASCGTSSRAMLSGLDWERPLRKGARVQTYSTVFFKGTDQPLARASKLSQDSIFKKQTLVLHFALQSRQLQPNLEYAEQRQWPPSGDHQITFSWNLAMATYGLSCTWPMCIPPSYADLGKAARDICSEGFGSGLVKLNVKTKSCSGVEFSTGILNIWFI